MSIKRNLSLFLCFVILTGLFVSCGKQKSVDSNISSDEVLETQEESVIDNLPIENTSKIELHLAEDLGFPMDKIEQEAITGAEYVELLDKLIAYAMPDKLDKWQASHSTLRSYDKDLNRYEAMAALYLAADIIGGYYDDFMMHNPDFLSTLLHDWNRDFFHSELFDKRENGSNLYYGGDCAKECYLYQAGYYFCTSRISNISGEFLFSYDETTNSFKYLANPTYAEAMLSIIRLISSAEPDLWQYETGEVDATYLAMADERREEIRNTVSDCTAGVTGTIYYISNSGSDTNDGKSPQTAFATVAPLWDEGMQDGDAILFERGGEWYLSAPDGYSPWVSGIDFAEMPGYPENVTVGAYGEGEKPLLRGDIQGVNEASFWTLYSDNNGVKIWKSTKNVIDASVILFNGGEEWADCVRPYLSADKTYFIHADGEVFTLENGLMEDLTFVWLPECTSEVVENLQGYRAGYTIEAPLYLRCDAGNPAEVYEEITVPQTSSAISLNIGCLAYDLDIRYFTTTGICVTSRTNTTEGQRFYNLEVGYCGGGLSAYHKIGEAQDEYGYAPFIAGGGIHIQSNSDIIVNGCYVYHCGPMATILSMHGYEGMADGEDVWENYLISDNLFEYCTAPGHIADLVMSNAPNATGFLSNYVFENNIVMNTGYGWLNRAVTQCETGIGRANGGWMSSVENEFGAGNNDGIYFRNNVFYRSSYALVSLRSTLADGVTEVNMNPIFEGNTYIQTSTLPLLAKDYGREFYYPSENVIQEMLGDKTGKLVILETE